MAKENLEKKLSEARYDLASVRLASRVGQEKNTSKVRVARRNVARILTEINS